MNFKDHQGFEKGESGILYFLCKAAQLGFIDVEYVNEYLKIFIFNFIENMRIIIYDALDMESFGVQLILELGFVS